jgi:NAD(P)-dependent dehydrogenase (short-subunit alcohol dehydrogenase family)
VGKTVLITGTSSGIGRQTALYFASKGWNVVATMRNPEGRQTDLKGRDHIDCVHLDVLVIESVRKAVRFARDKFGSIDVIVNNAGSATLGPFEASKKEQVQKQFNTNVIGLMDITKEIIPVFREQKYATIINVASMGGRVSFPFYSVYNSTKWAVEGFSESLQYELRPFNIRIKVIEPGFIETDFYSRSMETFQDDNTEVYDSYLQNSKKKMGSMKGSKPIVVAETILKAANDKSWRLRYTAGNDARLLSFIRKLAPDQLLFSILRGQAF